MSYLKDASVKNLKFHEIQIIGTTLTKAELKPKKAVIRNLSTNLEFHLTSEDFIINADDSLTIRNLEKVELFIYQDFDIVSAGD